MKNLMEYKGYHAKVEYDYVDNVLTGTVLGINDSLAFEGSSVDELNEAFQTTIDDYLILCEELGKEPDKEFKGSFNVRVTPAVHRDISLAAASRGITLNQLVATAISNELSRSAISSIIFHSQKTSVLDYTINRHQFPPTGELIQFPVRKGEISYALN